MPASSHPESSVLILYEFGDFQRLPANVDADDFKQYTKQLWLGRKWFYQSPEEETQTEETLLQKNGQAILQFDGREIRARNYVGFIGYNNLTIYILPKIFRHKSFTPYLAHQHLHFYLSYGSQAYFPFQWTLSDTTCSDNIIQWLILLFAHHAERVVSEQPFYAYEAIIEKTSFIRGRLAIQDYIREQISTGQWQHLHYEHTPYSYDNLFNRIVQHVASLLLPLACRESLPKLQIVLNTLNPVTPVSCTVDDCDAVPVVQLTQPQSQLLAMCRWFLGTAAIQEANSFTRNFSFLVPMERVFEDFITGFIQQRFPSWQAVSQSTTYLARSSGASVGLIRNDLWLPAAKVVIDAKYKLTAPSQIPAEDLYQMLAYAVARKTSRVHLLYPTSENRLTDSSILEIQLLPDHPPVTIHMHYLNITVSEDSPNLHDAFLRLIQHMQEKLQKSITFQLT